MKESQIVAAIMLELRRRGFFVFKIHGGPYQAAGLPDIFAVKDGLLYAFEVKQPGGRVTKLQSKRLTELAEHGAKAAAVTSVAEVCSLLDGHLLF